MAADRKRQELLVKIFQRYDKNGDGCISKKELGSLLRALSPESEVDPAAVVDHIDVNGDGKIDLEEFVNWIMEANADAEEKRAIIGTYAKAAHKQAEKARRMDLDSDGRVLGEAEIEELETTASASLDELAAMETPPKGALAILTAVHCLSRMTTHNFADSAEAIKSLIKREKFLGYLRNYNPEELGPHIIQLLHEPMQTTYFQYKHMAPQNEAAAILARWAKGAVLRANHAARTKSVRKDSEIAQEAVEKFDKKSRLSLT